jgi:hypothetical protein
MLPGSRETFVIFAPRVNSNFRQFADIVSENNRQAYGPVERGISHLIYRRMAKESLAKGEFQISNVECRNVSVG